MNDIEQKLAAWLRAGAPEPPRMMTAQTIIDDDVLHVPAPRVATRRAWSPALAAVAVVALVAIVVAVAAAVRSSHHSLPASPTPTVPAPTVQKSASTATPPRDFPALKIVGAQGPAAWSLSDTLSVSTDGGVSWAPVGLPAGVPASAISSLDVGTDGTVWLQVVHGQSQSVDLYRGGGGSWSRTRLVPQQPTGNAGLAAPYRYAFYSSGPIVAFVIGWGTAPIRDYTDLFLSTDGGANFVQHPTNIDWSIVSVTFVSPQVGLAVAGPADNYVYRTTDGGRTWTYQLGGDPSDNISYATPTVTASSVELPRYTAINAGAGEQDVAILTSTDQGATFRPTARTPLRVPSGFGTSMPLASIQGSNVWVAGTGRIYESKDNGQTWSTVVTAQAVVSLDVVSAAQAIGAATSGCSSYSTGPACLSDKYLIVTVDGGRSWHST
jgi:hypothetical protein